MNGACHEKWLELQFLAQSMRQAIKINSPFLWSEKIKPFFAKNLKLLNLTDINSQFLLKEYDTQWIFSQILPERKIQPFVLPNANTWNSKTHQTLIVRCFDSRWMGLVMEKDLNFSLWPKCCGTLFSPFCAKNLKLQNPTDINSQVFWTKMNGARHEKWLELQFLTISSWLCGMQNGSTWKWQFLSDKLTSGVCMFT